MRFIRKSEKGFISVLLILSLVISAVACASVVNAAENKQLADVAAGNYYLWGLNTNDPDFGAMTAPTGSFSYDGVKGYYYYDVHGASGDYCFVVSEVNNSGSAAVKSPAVGGAAEGGRYYLQQGNYHGYACMHFWNPSGEEVRIYFKSTSSGLCVVPLSSVDVTPTERPTTPSVPTTPTTPSTPSSNGYIYCKNDAGWGAVYAYMWNTDDDKNAKWPGVKMTYLGSNIWRYSIPGSYANIIFNIGSEEVQTADMVNPGAGKMYNNATETWSDYSGTTPTTPSTPTTYTDPTTPSIAPTSATTSTLPPVTPGSKVIFCEDAVGWGSLYAYMWNGSGTDKNAQWPGVQMTKIGNNIYRYNVPKDYEKIVFNIGSSAQQTKDLSIPGYGYIYNNKTEKWTIYDTSPLQVTSFTTDLQAPQYAGVGITLSASATGQGTVRYKFSATSSSGSTKVIADYSTKSSALWTPSSAGTYTLVYEFKDTSGNTNKRTLTFKVEDGSNSVSPYIKLVTPASGEQIKKSAACNVSVSAGGGKTGTKLLFYKFTVRDASGNIVNVPYYSLNAKCSFTPTVLGQYTVTVSVQGSDNMTVEHDYIYNSVNTIVTPTEPTDPSEPSVTPTGASQGTLKGDADSDGKVTILDATRIQRFLAALCPESDVQKDNADTDWDNKITILDATRIQRLLAGLITSF